jgi:hypothetical protein
MLQPMKLSLTGLLKTVFRLQDISFVYDLIYESFLM